MVVIKKFLKNLISCFIEIKWYVGLFLTFWSVLVGLESKFDRSLIGVSLSFKNPSSAGDSLTPQSLLASRIHLIRSAKAASLIRNF